MVFTQLFEWSCDDIAKECEVTLEPKGFTAVQISPPNEHIGGDARRTRYHPASYKLISRLGDEAAFASMVKRCAKVGVGIYGDGVINHMAAGSGRPNIGTGYGNCAFPNFHAGLVDLCTSCLYVQNKIAEYINSLKKHGAAGSRIDAAGGGPAGEGGGVARRLERRMLAVTGAFPAAVQSRGSRHD